jgi:uncharacterized protein involved in high-affinity Fe2+ transport
MAQTLYGRLFSTKTLVRIAFAALSLPSIGTAFAQGVPAGTQAPVYGTTWAAMRMQSHNVDPQTAALEASKAKATERDARLSAHRTGG